MSTVFDIEPIRRDRAKLEELLRSAGCVFKGKSIKCAFHDDQNPSAGIYQDHEGVWRYKCHGCKMNEDIIGIRAKLKGIEWTEEVKREREEATESEEKKIRVFASIDEMLKSVSSYSTIESHYVYANPTTKAPDAIVIRCRDLHGKKHFLQARPADGGFVMRSPLKPWPLYNRARVAAASTVIVAEGEKVVHLFHEAGYVATTSMAGAGKAEHADWSPLAGKTVYLWPDNDDTGISHMRDVAERLKLLSPPPAVNWIDPQRMGLPPKGDVEQLFAKGGCITPEDKRLEVECALNEATAFGPSATVRKLLELTISGERHAVEWPWKRLGEYTNALLPGTITAICGDPAASKSFMLLQAARYWHQKSIKFALYQLEADEHGSHLLRALVQESGMTDLWNWQWVHDNAQAALEAESKYRPFLDSFGSRMTVPAAEPPSLADLTDWVRDRMKDGCRVVAVDPVSAATTGNRRWDDDSKFVLLSQKCARDFNSSLIIVTHPKLGNKSHDMSGLAGGAAYSRFTQTVLWVKAYEPWKKVMVSADGSTRDLEINRSVKIAKARLGRGSGRELAFIFGGAMLFAEQGLLVKPKSVEEAIAGNAA